MGFTDKVKRATATAGIITTIAGARAPMPPASQLGRWQDQHNRQLMSQATRTKRNVPTTSRSK